MKTEMGRPTKLTHDVIAMITSKISQGVWPETAARLSGVSARTFYRWKELGEASEKGMAYEFLAAIEEAEATLEAKIVTELMADMKPADRLKFLGIRFRRYQDKASVEITGKNGGAIELAKVVIHEKSDDDIRKEQTAKRSADRG